MQISVQIGSVGASPQLQPHGLAVLSCVALSFYRATACNATHGIAVAILSVGLSVCPSVRQMRPIPAHNVSTEGDSEKKFNYNEYEVDHGLSNEP